MENIFDLTNGLIIYDGQCGICNELKHRITNLDEENRLKFIPYQKYDKIPRELTSRSMYLITGDKQVFKGAKAVLVTMLYLKGTTKFIGDILLKIKFNVFLEPFYSFISRFRGKISNFLGYSVCLI